MAEDGHDLKERKRRKKCLRNFPCLSVAEMDS